MAAAQRLKASEKQDVCKKLVTALKKQYSASLPKHSRDVLHTMIYGVCLENASVETADELYDQLLDTFHDLNEIRVSSISELEAVFHDSVDSDWRALRIRSLLQYVFEEFYQFDFEGLRRKTLDDANTTLAKVKDISPFLRLYTLQEMLGSHVLPVDERMVNVACWLGLVDDASLDAEAASDQLKSAVRKADVALFCHLLRQLSWDEPLYELILADLKEPPEEGFDLKAAPARLTEYQKLARSGKRPSKKAAASKKSTSRKSTTTKSSGKRTTKKSKTKKSTTSKKRSTVAPASKKAGRKTDSRKSTAKASESKSASKSKSKSKSGAVKRKTKTSRRKSG